MAEAAGDVLAVPAAGGTADARRMGRTEAGRSRWWITYPWGGAEAFYGTAGEAVAHVAKRAAERDTTAR